MPAKLETWLEVQSGARLTADGHLGIGYPTGAAAVAVSIAPGTFQTFASAAAGLEAALQLAFPAAAFTVATGTDVINIAAATANFDMEWKDEEAQAYFGYNQAVYINKANQRSDTTPSGRRTCTHGAVPRFGIELLRRGKTNHAGVAGGTYLATHALDSRRYRITATEIAHFLKIAQRIALGIPMRAWLDSTNGNPFAWTAADWVAGRDLALVDPSQAKNLADWVTAPWTHYRDVSLDCKEVS
jgi:hypothetical protein